MAEGVLTSAEINPSELPRFHMLSLDLHQRLLGIISRVLSKHLAQNGEIGFILLITEPSSRKSSQSVCFKATLLPRNSSYLRNDEQSISKSLNSELGSSFHAGLVFHKSIGYCHLQCPCSWHHTSCKGTAPISI